MPADEDGDVGGDDRGDTFEEGAPVEASGSQSARFYGADGNLSTGIDWLDEWCGGFSPGSVVALVADPDAPSEELLYPAADAAPARYLSLLRTDPEVSRHAAATGHDDFDVTETTTARLMDDPAGALSGLDPESVVVVDPATELEREGRERYQSFLETLQRAVETTESVAILHCPRMNPRALQRDLTLARADTVLELERYVGDGPAMQVRWYLYVNKSRFGRVPDTPHRVAFHDGPHAVRSRDI